MNKKISPLKLYFTPHKAEDPEAGFLHHQDLPESKTIPFYASVQAKFAMSSFIILSAVLLLLNFYPLQATQFLLYNSKKASLENQIAVISSVLMELETLSDTAVQRVMLTIELGGLSRVIVTDPSGKIIYDNLEPNGVPIESYALSQEIYLALTRNDVAVTQFIGSVVYSTAAAPIIYGDNTIGAIFIQEDDPAQGKLLRTLQENLRTISWVAAGVAALLYVIFSILFTNRIRALLLAIRIVGAGDYGHRLLTKGNDEMTYLAKEFNVLTDRLQTTEEVRRRFVSDASHELRTPLASIRLLADSILHNQAMDPKMTMEFVADICTESERLTRITERLLSLSKLDSLPAPVAEVVDVNQVIERVLQNLELVAEESGVEMRFFPEDPLFLLCTTDKLHQICHNLLENALKYTPSGGFAQISARIDQKEVLIEVTDNGIGIPPEDLPKIFNRFYRVDDARSREAGGTGLGLSIVRDTLRSYGGWVEARGNSPCGTIFSVGLPLAEHNSPEKQEETQ